MSRAPGRPRRAACAAVALTMLVGTGLAGVARSATRAEAAPRPRAVSVKDSPGYVPLVDPESMSVVTGRRANAPAVRQPFQDGARSLDDLGRTICRTIHRVDRDSLLGLCIDQEEFRDILWREFPQSRPATGLAWEDAWRILYARLHAGCVHALRDHGGHVYQFVSFRPETTTTFRNFQLHNGLTLIARDDEGQIQQWRWVRSVAEREGRFKIYSTED
jgi:hypothetical protein